MWVLLAGSTFWIPVAVGYAALANARGGTYMSLVASLLAAAMNIGGNLYLIPRYGMTGCAWATLFAYAASLIVFAVLLNRTVRMPLSWVFTASIPSTLGAVLITATGSPWLGLAGCLATGGTIAVVYRVSLAETWNFFLNLRDSGLGSSEA